MIHTRSSRTIYCCQSFVLMKLTFINIHLHYFINSFNIKYTKNMSNDFSPFVFLGKKFFFFVLYVSYLMVNKVYIFFKKYLSSYANNGSRSIRKLYLKYIFLFLFCMDKHRAFNF